MDICILTSGVSLETFPETMLKPFSDRLIKVLNSGATVSKHDAKQKACIIVRDSLVSKYLSLPETLDISQ